jgi:hypothetical protein
MTSRIIRIGRGKLGSAQMVTTQWLAGPDGTVHEHVTLETPKHMSDTAKLRLITSQEAGKSWR